MTRKELEQAALEAVCALDYFTLAGDIDSVDDKTLREIIANPHAIHQAEDYALDCDGEIVGEEFKQ